MMGDSHDPDSSTTREPTREESRTEFDVTPPPIPGIKRPTVKSTLPNLDFLRPGEALGELGRLGGYRILSVLGIGGMGVVFQAEDPHLKRLVALKVMKPLLAVHDNARKRFTREAQSAAAINHEHVVHIYQVGEDQGVPFLAMELLEGESLDVVLRREKQLPLAEVLRISREAASGLAAAHRRGLIHRDVKPANIMLVPLDPTVQVARTLTDGSDFMMPSANGPTDSGSMTTLSPSSWSATDIWLTRVKIVDFGLARATEGDEELTQSGQVTGTPQYMSPEQVEGQDVDHRSDLFSLGCVMYRMLCGETPFSGRSSSALLLAIAERPHKPLRAHLPNVSPRVEAVIDRLLAKSPKDRFQTALELMQTLADLERQLGAGQLLDETPPTSEVIPADSSASTTSLTVPDLQRLRDADTVTVRTEVSRLRLRNFLRSRSLVTAVCGVLLLVGLAVGWRRMQSNPPAGDVNRERPGVARQAESVNSDAALLATAELPPLEEWLKGREVLTVSQDGRGQFKSIQEALKKLKPSQVVQVLDRGPYREAFHLAPPSDTGLVSLIGTKIEFDEDHWNETRKTTDGRKEYVGWSLSPNDKFRLSGFDLEAKDEAVPADVEALLVLRLLSKDDTIIDGCRIDARRLGSKFRKLMKSPRTLDLSCHGAGPYRIQIVGNWFRGPHMALRNLSTYPLAKVLFARNYISEAETGIETRAARDQFIVRENVIEAARNGIAIPAERSYWGYDGTDLVTLVANNSVTARYPIFIYSSKSTADAKILESVEIQGNLLVSSERNPILFAPPADADNELVRTVLEKWTVSHNAYSPALTDRRYPKQASDVEFPNSPLPFVINPLAPDYFRIDAASPLAKGGAHGELPSYIGALPPGLVPRDGDWFSRLRERWSSTPADSQEANSSEPSVPKDYALSFDGKDSYVRIGQLAYRGDSDLTVECRVTPLSKAFSSVFGNNEQGGVGLGISTTGSWAFFVGQQQEGTNPYALAQATEPVKLGEEVYLAAVFDRRTVKLFVNGKLQATTEWKGPFKPSDLPFWMGADPCPEAAKTSPLYRAFHGLIDELRVSSAAKYSKDFEPASRLEKDSSTLLLYHFDEGPGPKVYDHSGHHRFGDNRGAKWQERTQARVTAAPSISTKTPNELIQEQAKVERRAAEWALRIGGTVKLSFSDGTVRPISAEKDLPKESFAVETIDVSNNPRVTDDDVRTFVSGLQELRSLQIHHTSITDAALGAIRNSQSLYSLHLESTNITDKGVETLGTLPNLIHLQLNLTKVTEACLPLVLRQPALTGLNIGSLPASETTAERLFASSRWRGLGLHESWIQPEHVTRLAQLPEFFSLLICGDLPVERLRLLGALPALQRLVFFGHQRWTPELSANLKVLPKLDTLEMWSVKPSTGWAELANARPWKSLHFFRTHVDDQLFDGLDRVDSLNTLKLDQTTQSRTRLQQFRVEHPRVDVISNSSRSRDREVAERLLRLGGIEIETVDKQGFRSVRRVEDLPDTEFMLWSVFVRDCQDFDDRMLASLIGLDDLRRLVLTGSTVTDFGLKALDQLPRLISLNLAEGQTTPSGLQMVARQSRLEYLHLAACDVTALRTLADLKQLWHFSIDKVDSAYVEEVLDVVIAQFPELTSLGYLTVNARIAERLLRLPKLKTLVGPATILIPETVPLLSRHPMLRRMDLYGITPQPWGNLGSLLRIQEVHVGVGKLDEQKIAHLAELPQLQTLTFDRLKFTSEALAQMAKLRHVATIQFTGCEISDADWTRITEALPNSRLLWNSQPRTR